MAVVKCRVPLVGTRFSYAPGDVVEVDDAEAKRWVDAGYADYEGKPPQPRKAPTVESDDAAGSDAPAPSVEKPKRGGRKPKS